jgi:hypothetical protein
MLQSLQQRQTRQSASSLLSRLDSQEKERPEGDSRPRARDGRGSGEGEGEVGLEDLPLRYFKEGRYEHVLRVWNAKNAARRGVVAPPVQSPNRHLSISVRRREERREKIQHRRFRREAEERRQSSPLGFGAPRSAPDDKKKPGRPSGPRATPPAEEEEWD